MITIKSEKQSYGINFPTDVKEITPEALIKITKDIVLPEHYCVVALAMKTKLFNYVTVIKNNKDMEVAVTPLLAKINSNEHIANVGDKLIVDRSSLERGNHINLKTVISSNCAKKYFEDDNELTKNITLAKNDIYKNASIIVVEFKILPVCDIKGSLPINSTPDDPFIYLANIEH